MEMTLAMEIAMCAGVFVSMYLMTFLSFPGRVNFA